MAYTTLEADSFEFEMLSCNQSKPEHAFYLWNVSGYWRIKDEKTGLKGTLDQDHGGMRHGGIQALVRQAALHQGERKEKEEVKSEMIPIST